MRISESSFHEISTNNYNSLRSATGLTVDRIPEVASIDERLAEFGWRAVAITGFIPPAVFVEFQARKILAIACDIRKLEHLDYTPSPDIVHEASGHAPFIADSAYRAFLQELGETTSRALFSKGDIEIYEAILHLSEIKEDPTSSEQQRTYAYRALEAAKSRTEYTSEATLCARFAWWTIEYGLIGSMSSPKIYGAGLLSSISEGYHVLHGETRPRLIPFSLDCLQMSYDITRPQPQLYVTPNFEALRDALQELKQSLACVRGGVYGLSRALTGQGLCTIESPEKIQVSGVIESFDIDENTNESIAAFIKFSGPCQVSQNGKQLDGQGAERHPSGYSLPIGFFSDGTALAKYSLAELKNKYEKNGLIELNYRSGVRVTGRIDSSIEFLGKLTLITLNDCIVIDAHGKQRYQPEWGPFDLAAITSIQSVFADAADRLPFWKSTGVFPKQTRTQKINLTHENTRLNDLYKQFDRAHSLDELSKIALNLDKEYPNDWLLRFQLEERCVEMKYTELAASIKESLEKITQKNNTIGELLRRGREIKPNIMSKDKS